MVESWTRLQPQSWREVQDVKLYLEGRVRHGPCFQGAHSTTKRQLDIHSN